VLEPLGLQLPPKPEPTPPPERKPAPRKAAKK